MVTRIETFVICAVFAAMFGFAFNPALANGNKDADKNKAEQKVITVTMALGSDTDKKRRFHPHNLTFQKGKRYRLVIHNPSLDVHEFDSPGLVGAVWSSHVKVLDGYGEGAQVVAIVVGTPAEIEILPGASIEWEFVPVAAGRYEMICDTKDQKGKTHTSQGMTGTILVQ